jgi:hypothetical protein
MRIISTMPNWMKIAYYTVLGIIMVCNLLEEPAKGALPPGWEYAPFIASVVGTFFMTFLPALQSSPADAKSSHSDA